MTALTDYLEENLINHLYRTGAYSPPANLYFAFFSTVTDGETSSVTEFAFLNGYARASVVRNGTNFTRTNQQIKNATAIAFPTPTGAQGTATHWGCFDAATAGNLLFYGALDSPKVIDAASPAPEWGIGDFTFNFTTKTNYLANALADWLFIGTALAKPTSINFALHTVSPTASTTGTEVVSAEYARVSVTPLDTNFASVVAGNGFTQNSNIITFPDPTTQAYGAVVAGAAIDQAGNMLTYGVYPSFTVNAGDDAPKISIGGFTVTLD